MNQYKLSTLLAAGSSGPITAIILFLCIGDHWSPMELRTVFTIGILLASISLTVTYSFDDDKSLHSEQSLQKSTAKDEPATDNNLEIGNGSNKSLEEPLLFQGNDR